MQNVAWPTTIGQRDSVTPPVTKNELSAIPVMIPGSAIGRTRTKDTSSRPKKRKRWTAKAAADPSPSAIPVEISPTRTDSQSASRISVFRQACPNQLVENRVIGHDCTFEALNA